MEEDTFRIDIEAAIKVLETTPHPRHELDDETIEWMKKLLNKLDSEDFSETGPTDALVNLDKYIY